MATTAEERKSAAAAAAAIKKANLLDPNSIKHLLDETVSEIVKAKGFVEDVRISNAKLALGSVIIVIALFAQFYKKKFPQNRDFLMLVGFTKEKNAILFTYPLAGSFNSTGLVVSSKLPRFSDQYTLAISSSDPKSISAKNPVHLQKSVTKWFTKDGILVEGLLWKDVERLIDNYFGDKKTK